MCDPKSSQQLFHNIYIPLIHIVSTRRHRDDPLRELIFQILSVLDDARGKATSEQKQQRKNTRRHFQHMTAQNKHHALFNNAKGKTRNHNCVILYNVWRRVFEKEFEKISFSVKEQHHHVLKKMYVGHRGSSGGGGGGVVSSSRRRRSK